MYDVAKLRKNLKYPVAFFLALLYFLFQFHFLQQYLDWDQIAYLGNVNNSLKPGNIPVYNPHHLHLETGSKFFHLAMVKYFGQAGFTDVLFNNRLKSILAASLGIFFACLYFTNVTKKLSWGMLGSLLIGISHGYMVYAAKFDTGIFPALGILIYLWCMEKMARTEKRLILTALLTGVLLFVGLMFHQYLGIACVTFFISVIVPSWIFDWNPGLKPFAIFKVEKKPQIDRSPSRRYLAVLLMTLICIILSVSAYFWAGKSQYNLPFSMDDPRPARGLFGKVLFQKWLFIYETADAWGKGLEEFDPRDPFRGYTDAFLSRGANRSKYSRDYRFDYNLAEPLAEKSRPANALALFTLLTLAGTLFFLPALFRRYRRCILFLFSTAILQVIFSTYWESFYFEFWIVPAILVSALGILLLNLWVEQLQCVRLHILALACYLSLGLFIGLTAGHNLHEHLIPYSRIQRLETGGSQVRQDYYRTLFSRSIYLYPDDVYQSIRQKK